MSNRKEVLGKLWAHFNFSLNSLVDRIVLQKTIYVLSYLNYPNLGDYKKDFAMYIHGPYSPLLAHDAYDLSENLKIKSGFSETEEEKVSLFEESVKFAAEGKNNLALILMGSRDKCSFGQSAHCTRCGKADKCQLKKILCDTNVISAAFLEEKEQDIAMTFLENHRQKHLIVITKEILGEIIGVLLTKSGNDQLALDNI